MPSTVSPYRPDEERETSLTELTEILLEIKDTMVVEGYRHTNFVQRGSITLVVLYGIDIGMKHIRTVDNIT